MVILGDNNSGNNADTRDLIFSTQSLVRKTEKTITDKMTNEKLSLSQLQDSNSGTAFVANINNQNSRNQNTYSTIDDHEWVLETQLHKRRVTKDIMHLQHLLNQNIKY